MRTPARFREARVWSRALSEAEVATPDRAARRGPRPLARRGRREGGPARGRRLLLRLRRRLRAEHDALGRELLPERRRLRRPHPAPRDGRDQEAAAVRGRRAGGPREGRRRRPQPVRLHDALRDRGRAVPGPGRRPGPRRGGPPRSRRASPRDEAGHDPPPGDRPGAGGRALARPDLRPEDGHAVGEGRPRPRTRAAPPRSAEARPAPRHRGAAGAPRDRRRRSRSPSGAPTSPTASTPRRACSPRSSRRAWSSWPARCGPTSGARPTTTTAAAT